MTLQGRVTFNKTVGLSPDLYARWRAYEQETGQSFNGLILAYLEQTLPKTEERQP
jgi:hypothetical protein